jgi:hypothetical protein
MQSLNPVAGQLFDVFETEEIQLWVDVFLKIPSTKILDNDCHGVDEKNSYNFLVSENYFF